MVATRQATRSDAAAVAAAAAHLHRAGGRSDAELVTLGDLSAAGDLGDHVPCIRVASDRVVEVVLGDAVEPGAVGEDVARLCREDWRVTVLVPSARMGLAHSALRGSGCTLQQWWRRGAAIDFGTIEIP